VVEGVGELETLLLVIIGIDSLVALALSYAFALPFVARLFCWFLAIPLALPWIGIALLMSVMGIVSTLSTVAPGASFRQPIREPTAPSIQLRLSQSRAFRRRGFMDRIVKMYLFYLKHGAIASGICAFILFMIVGLFIFTHPK
jgi:hypothetical protein